jgi:hypothetical protein
VALKGQIRWLILLVLATVPLTVAFLSRPGRAFLIRTIHGVPPTDDPRAEMPDRSAAWQPYVVNVATNCVERYRRPGELLWSTPVKEPLGPYSRTSVVADDRRVYVGFSGGVLAFDADSGRLQWQDPGECERLLLDEDLVLGIGRGALGLAARNQETGKRVFAVALPDHCWVKGILPLNGLIVVWYTQEASLHPTSILVTRQGRVRNTLDCQVVAGCEEAGREYYLTGDDVRQLTAEGLERWRVPFPRSQDHAGGDLRIMGGELIASLCGRISDSGVQVARIDRNHGTLVWATDCQGLRVEHSEYHHETKLKLIDGRFIEVLSKGSKGCFVEVLDLSSGISVFRKRS